MSTAIEFDHVGKQYRLGLVSTRTLSHDLNRWWQTAVLKKEDPYLTIGEVNDRSTFGSSEYVWALKDINFKVEQGDVVGIIGKNGAGKSTLLKLLSKVTGPTVGEIRARGRIGSLLEVGTGFHPEMTGRENIFMNGAIMGMTKNDITNKLDEIISFSGCERYIDTPVKRYSSGMKVRLGFAVAAHLEPEILVVDEVLAVGDAEFQKKAIGKMQEVSRGGGRTVLFVSHNMTSIRSLCNTGILLENGMVREQGEINTVVSHYLSGGSSLLNHKLFDNDKELTGKGFEMLEMGIRKRGASFEDVMTIKDELEIYIRYRLDRPIKQLHLTLLMKNDQGNKIFSFSGGGRCYDFYHESGEYVQTCIIPANFLNWGNYALDVVVVEDRARDFLHSSDVLSFTLSNKAHSLGAYMGKEPGDITPRFVFTEEKVQ